MNFRVRAPFKWALGFALLLALGMLVHGLLMPTSLDHSEWHLSPTTLVRRPIVAEPSADEHGWWSVTVRGFGVPRYRCFVCAHGREQAERESLKHANARLVVNAWNGAHAGGVWPDPACPSGALAYEQW